MENKTTTVAVYRGDLKELEKEMKKGENFRDKIHKILHDYFKENKK